jgi:general stress protein 26
MPKGYGLKQSSKGMVPWSAVEERLAKARNYWLVTSGQGGRPHATPVWGLWSDGFFWFSTDPASRKGRDIASNPETVVHLESGDDVAIIEGVAERLAPNNPILATFAESYEKKYRFRLDANNPSYGIYRVKPRAAYAWFEKNFPESATRWLF